ncbi:MAG TPA: hypothetical protein VGQ52_14840 [Gemmatimonadaceae bacterium]|nr:hypothetical protein [Gemmatimonadaceae bacterium]
MPILWEWRDSVLLITTVGAYSNEEMANAFAEMREDKRFVSRYARRLRRTRVKG